MITQETKQEKLSGLISIGTKKLNWKEWIIERIIVLGGVITIILVVLIFLFLAKDALPILKTQSIWKLLSDKQWYPLSEPAVFGFLPLIIGSILVTAGAIVIGVPIGVAAAIYIGEVAQPRIREILKPTIEVLASIPSVVIGFLGMMLLAPYLQATFKLSTGLTAFTGALMLAFMAMPTIISISEDALHAVPKDYRAGSLALGATKWQTIRRVVIPAAKSGILASIMLGIGRAIGETMTVLMVTGNAAVIPQWGNNQYFFFTPVRTITATIAAEMGEVVRNSDHYYALFALGLLLFMITFLVNFIADLALEKNRRM